jgi:hypothetical protein
MGRARAAGATRRRMHISAPPAATPFGDRGPQAGRRSCSTRSGPTRLRLPISAPPAAGPARGPWAASGPEELRDSERSHGCRRDAVTVCFQYLVLQVTVSDDSTYCSELALLHSELGVAIRILPFEVWPRVLKQTARKLDQSSYNPNSSVGLVDILSWGTAHVSFCHCAKTLQITLTQRDGVRAARRAAAARATRAHPHEPTCLPAPRTAGPRLGGPGRCPQARHLRSTKRLRRRASTSQPSRPPGTSCSRSTVGSLPGPRSPLRHAPLHRERSETRAQKSLARFMVWHDYPGFEFAKRGVRACARVPAT